MSHPPPPANDQEQRGAAGPDLELTWPQRNALTHELFAHWRAQGNEGHNCFCGSDADLIRAVIDARADAARDQFRTDARTGARGDASGRWARGELAQRVARVAQESQSRPSAQGSAEGLDGGVDAGRREQLLRWHEDDHAAAGQLAAHGGVDSDDLDGDA